mgnify:CR=1 FL=1
MRNQVFKKLFSVLLALIMVAGLLPASVLAEGEGNADSTPAPTEAVQPTESAEPTTPTETETPEVTEVPEPTPENPAATVEPTQGEPTAEPTDEGIMPANVMPVQANVELQYRIVHLDCGREYFTKDWIIALINEMAEAGYNQLQLAFGNGGFRFYLNNMAVGSYSHEQVMGALEAGNKHYNIYGDGENGPTNSEWITYNPSVNALTQTEMDTIIKHAQSKGIEIVPMLNTPGHMHAVLAAMSELGISGNLQVSGKPGCLNLENTVAVSFTKELVSKYVKYFADNGCNFFNAAMDEYSSWENVFYNYANDIISIITGNNMTPRMFNDALRSNNTISNSNVQVCYWFYGNDCYPVDQITQYQLINANHDYYYVSTNENWNLYKEGYTFVGEYNEDTWINKAKQFNNNTFNYGRGFGTHVNNPVGSMFCIWCNTPGKNTETQIAQQIRMILRVIGACMQNSDIYSASDVHVEGGFKADGTINVPTNNKTVVNDNDTVRVTGPNLAALTAPEHTGEIAGIEAVEGRIMAYDVTPSTADNTYTGEAEVRIKIPAEWDSSKVNAFIVGNDSTVNDITGKTEDGWYVFTAPHFSVMGIYEKAATTEVGGTITIVEGKEEVLTVDGEVAKNKIGDPADTAVAIKTGVEYGTKPGEGTQFTLGNKITTGDGVISDGNGNYLVVSEKGEISNTKEIADATVFNVTSSGYLTTYYTIQVKGRNQYLTINNNNKLAIQNSSSPWYYYNGYGFYQQKGRNYYYLKFNNGWTASTGNGTSGYLYKRADSPNLVDITKITFKGIKSGTTTVTIAGVEYNIEVKAAELENVVLPINLWITNTGVVPTNWSNGTPAEFTYNDDGGNRRSIYTLKASHSTVNSPNGISLSSILPQVTGTAKSWDNNTYNVVYWKSAYHTAENRQSTDGWTNYSHKGIKFEYIRFYEGSWAYSVDGITWVNIENVGAGATDTDKNQVCIWYRQVTTVTSEVTTEIVDWGPIEYGANQCLLDFAVKYDGTSDRIPNTFPATGKTMGFDCPPDQTVPLGNGYVVKDTDGTYYRTVYGIAGVETSNYEVYMITLTPSNDNHSVYINKNSTLTSYNYDGTEKIAWAKTEADANSAEQYKMPNVKYGGEPFLESVKIYQYQGLLVTYYLRAKETTDSLTVHYAIDGTNVEFHKYNIIVKANADGTYPTFDENIGLNKTNPKGPLDNGTIVNSTDVTITVSSDLSTLNNLEPQYRYSDYDVKRSWREDDKNVWIYYTFKREHTYVIDFGLPLKIKFSDFGVTNDEAIGTVSLWEKETVLENKGLYGTAKVITGSTEGKYVLYTLDKPLDKNITIPLYVKFNQRGDNDKPQLFTANIIPATNVYYEDSFAKFTNGSYVDGESNSQEIKWGIEGTSTEANATQALEALGNKTNVYGYDPAYNNCTMFSMGSARKVTVTSTMATTGVVWPTAQFTFKGTGFDIISLTDNTSGAIFVDVYAGKEAKGTMVKSYIVDNYYGYTQDESGNWVVDKTAKDNAIYQIPVMQVRNLTYGEYTAVVTVFYDKAFNHTAKNEYNFWLDAVRVYDPAGTDLDNEYVKDKEGFPQYIKLRDELAKTENTTVNVKSMVFIDGGNTANIATYANIGPNNEVYLAQGQAITFKLAGNDLSKIATVQIGAKSPNSNETNKASMVIGNAVKELGTATEMYYDITDAAKNGNAITITNNGNAILSLTNLKITFASKPDAEVTLAKLSEAEQNEAVVTVRALFAPAPIEPEPEPEPEKTFEPERFEASWSRNVIQGRKATLTVKTSEDVEAITVDGQTIRSYRTRTERVGFGRRAKRITYREFTYSMVAQESADFSVTAINAEGTESEAITARLTVKTRPNSLRDMWDWFKGWF